MAAWLRTAALLGVLCITFGGCQLEDDYPVQEFIDDLDLQVSPKPATPGESVTFFVQGEPPAKLRAMRFADLLSDDGDLLFRLESAQKGKAPTAIPYPLPSGYQPPEGLVPLQARQTLRLPTDVELGHYTFRGQIVQIGHGPERHGTPTTGINIGSPGASEEGQIRDLIKRFQSALRASDDETACDLVTPAARPEPCRFDHARAELGSRDVGDVQISSSDSGRATVEMVQPRSGRFAFRIDVALFKSNWLIDGLPDDLT